MLGGLVLGVLLPSGALPPLRLALGLALRFVLLWPASPPILLGRFGHTVG